MTRFQIICMDSQRQEMLFFPTYYFLVWDDQCAVVVFIVGRGIKVLNIFYYLSRERKCYPQKVQNSQAMTFLMYLVFV